MERVGHGQERRRSLYDAQVPVEGPAGHLHTTTAAFQKRDCQLPVRLRDPAPGGSPPGAAGMCAYAGWNSAIVFPSGSLNHAERPTGVVRT